jgi:hypothetical protein
VPTSGVSDQSPEGAGEVHAALLRPPVLRRLGDRYPVIEVEPIVFPVRPVAHREVRISRRVRPVLDHLADEIAARS